MNADNQDKQHKAAALKYRRGADAAPVITAKGRGAVADKIIELARRAGVPIREDRNMVEVLSAMELHEEIPPELYKAVAEILAYIYTMSGKR